MKVGNKLHAILLSVIGLVAVVALVLQMKAKMTRPVVQNAVKPAASTPTPEAPSTLPKVVYGDPFTHPKLPRLQPAMKVNAAPIEPPASELSGKPGLLSGPFGFEAVHPEVSSKEEGADSTKAAAKVDVPTIKLPLLGLRAVVAAPHPVAFISIDGKEPQEFGPGDTILKGITVLRIHEGEVEILVFKRVRTIRMGGQLQL